MIGQKNLIKQIDYIIKADCFPRFSIFVGMQGSEKNLFAKYISDNMNALYVAVPDVKIDTIRQMIEQSYKIHDTTVYAIKDADDMSVQAKNALLKVTEEPPNNAYFVMTLEDVNNTLDTIKSRAVIYQLEPYTPKEITAYAQTTYQDNIELYKDLCDTPGDVDMLYKVGAEDFYAYVEKVVDHIATASGANVFKIADKLALKDEEDKYDLKLFWKAFADICLRRGKARGNAQELVKYCTVYSITSKTIQKFAIRGINRQQLFDMWILEVRKAWM